MKEINKLTIIVMFLNLLIVIPFGHGMIILGFLELFSFLFFTHDSPDPFSLKCFEDSISTVSLLSLFGQLILLFSLFKSKIQCVIKIVGNSILLIAYILLCKDLFVNELPRFSFFTGLPFLGSSIGLFLMISKEKAT